MTRSTGIVLFVLLSLFANAQGDQQVRAKADALFDEKAYAEALPLYSQLVSLAPSDRVLNYKFGTCLLFGGTDKDKSIGHLKFATQDPAIPPDAWYWLGRAYHLNYQFKDAQAAYQRYQGTGSKKELEGFPIAALDKQCRNGQNLLSNLKEITVHNKVEVEDSEFFRFYELGDIGGKIVVLPEELKSTLDKKSKRRTLVYLPEKGGAIYFASYGKDGKTGLDIYRTELLSNGTFAVPVKLAGYVNTDQDEDFAFLHPDGRNFYFSSKGHNSMGGYDVFRSAFDKVSETFGPPENLDFAVNTPDDDLFYMTDGENKQACFASGRDSRQGKLHVYRVGTAQMPVVVTVMKGTYASAFDQDDRKAHIMVEDAVTRERVADVRTDINGSYVLALPRSGKFRYLVECGPSGRTHTGVVDVPRANSARAFRQELELTRKGDLEELVIRNYFDAPLEEDMIALMMEEIKRRARLDVTGDRPAIAEQPATPEPTGDVLTQAGFAGDVTEEKALQLAKDDAREQEQLVKELEQQSAQAFTIAEDAATAAEQAAREAMAAADKATVETDETRRNILMKEAAQLRQQSRTANLRARAAHRAAVDLDAERMAVQQRANTASRLATDLGQSLSTQQKDATLAQLKTLKERLDTKSGPNGDLPLAERTRRTLAEQEKEAARRMNMATAKRAEETELADSIERAKREREAAKGKSKKDELSRTIAEQEQQLAYLHAEVEGAFNTAKEHETGTAVMRGQHSLVHHLAGQESTTTTTPPNKEAIAGLGQRIAGNDSRIAAIPVDDRFDGLSDEPASIMESRSFNWEVVGPAAVLAAAAVPTATMQRDGRNDAEQANARTTTIASTAPGQGQVRGTDVAQVPISSGDELASAGAAVGEVQKTDGSGSNAEPIDAAQRTGGTNGTATNSTLNTSNGSAEERVNTTNSTTTASDSTSETAQDVNATAQEPNSGEVQQGGTTGQGTGVDQTSLANATSNERDGVNANEGANTSQAGGEGSTSDAVVPSSTTTAGTTTTGTTGSENGASTAEAVQPPSTTTTGSNTTGETFLLENERAELQQAIAAERNAARRDELRAQLTALEQRITSSDASAATTTSPDLTTEEDLSMDGVDMQRTPLTFFPDTKADDIVTLVYPGYATDKAKLESVADPVERADGLSGLELMLADSLRDELVRQAAILELAPQQGEVVLPRMERLRAMRQEHVLEAERITREAEALAQAQAEEREGLARTASRSTYAPGEHPVTDRFIFKQADPQEVFASKVVHRSSKVDEAVAMKEADLERMVLLDERIDSLEAAMVDLPRKEYDKKRREADKLIDERMIIRSELGLRSAYLTKEEWRHTEDSLKTIDKRVTALGLAPDENLLLMSESMRTDAKARFTEAAALRKKADRTEDILLRDSLLRTAYGTELEALQELDKSITVKTYLLSDRFQRGETLAYDEVARRALGITDEVLLADARRARPSTSEIPSISTEQPRVDQVSEQELRTPAQQENDATGTADTAATQATNTAAQQPSEANAEVVVQGELVATASEPARATDAGEVSSTAGNDATTRGEGVNAAPASTGTTTAGSEDSEALAARARGSANDRIDQALDTLPLSARVPARLYENFLQGENVMLKVEALDPAFDPQMLSDRAAQAVRESAELEQRSLAMNDRATNLEDSATTARKRDRDELAQLAVRSRVEADSLHERSLAMAEQARVLELQKRDAEQAKVLRERLVKYYYLSNEEQSLVLDDPDMSRYFQMKARAHEQRDAAAEAGSSARVNRELSELLRSEAEAVKADENAGRITPAEAVAKREVLYGRAEMLSARADSLSNISARLRGAADINENQAGVLLQGTAADRSTEWMAMEMRTRRTEPLLAQADRRTPASVQPPTSTTSAVVGEEIAQADPSTTTSDPTERPVVRQIAAPFGTDQRGERPEIVRPIAEIPAGDAPTMVFPEVLVNDMFEFRSTGERKPVSIPMDARLPSGIVFKVQIGAFRAPIAEEVFSDMTPVMGERTETGFIRYTAGLFTGFQQAARAKDRVRDRGYRDAFVVAYRDGKRIPLGVAMREARALAEAEAAGATATPVAPTTSSTTPPATTTPAGSTSTQQPSGATGDVANVTAPNNTGNSVLEPARTSTEPTPAIIQRPLSTPATPAPALTAEQILAKYPASVEAIVDAYVPAPEAAAYYNVPGAAPATQVELIKGLFYTVQVGVYSKPVPLDKLFNITPLNSERTETAKVRYTTGRYNDTEQARLRKEQAVALGVKDAFVTAYLNGKRIPMQEAAALLQQFGPAILAKP